MVTGRVSKNIKKADFLTKCLDSLEIMLLNKNLSSVGIIISVRVGLKFFCTFHEFENALIMSFTSHSLKVCACIVSCALETEKLRCIVSASRNLGSSQEVHKHPAVGA